MCPRRLPLALLAAAALATGCGGDEERRADQRVPAAGENTPLTTPGVPDGASYDLTGTEWLELDQGQQFDTAAEFVADNPSRCEDVATADVVGYAVVSVGFDFPLTAPVSEALAEGCDAARQS